MRNGAALSIPQGQYVLASGRYFGTVRESVAVQNEHGYSVAYLVQFQREIDPCRGWFLARDVVTAWWLDADGNNLAWRMRAIDALVPPPTSRGLFEDVIAPMGLDYEEEVMRGVVQSSFE